MKTALHDLIVEVIEADEDEDDALDTEDVEFLRYCKAYAGKCYVHYLAMCVERGVAPSAIEFGAASFTTGLTVGIEAMSK